MVARSCELVKCFMPLRGKNTKRKGELKKQKKYPILVDPNPNQCYLDGVEGNNTNTNTN